MRIIWVPLESFEERYTQDWARWFPQEFRRLNIEFVTIEGRPLTSKIETGDVLDAFGTNAYKASQLEIIMQQWRAGAVGRSDDVFFFADLWFPGIEMLAYTRAFMRDDPPRIAGILHAGTYDPHDFTNRCGMRAWGQHFEKALGNIVDHVFVATNYHKSVLPPDLRRKAFATRLPFYPDELRAKYAIDEELFERERAIVFPHRITPEKGWDEYSDWVVEHTIPSRITHRLCKTKQEYYGTLASCAGAVSFAKQETFGYAMLEAAALGCVPLVPNRLSYPELFPRENIYTTQQELTRKAYQVLVGEIPAPNLKSLALEHSIERMMVLCKDLSR